MKQTRLDRIFRDVHSVRVTSLAVMLLFAKSVPAQIAAGATSRNVSTIAADAPDPRTRFDEARTDVAAATLTSGRDLPDAPGESSSAPIPLRGKAFAAVDAPIQVSPIAPIYHKYIEPGQKAQPLTSADKVLFGVHQLMSPYLLLTIAAAAGYEQAANGSPNYGTNFPAYGQRVGAAAIRDASQTIFEDSIMAPILHEDPRYYVMGNRHNLIVRTTYAISKVFVTRSDDGCATPNYSLFAAYAGAAALENAYYPDDNHGLTETAKSFGGSIGGAALSNVVREFLPNILHTVRLEQALP